jgi:hypothetical protein
MNILPLIDLCRKDNGAAWAELWLSVKRAAFRPIRQMLSVRNLDLSLADDAMQELYTYLQASEMRRLRNFRGTTEAAFVCYLRMVALRFTMRKLRKWLGVQHREAKACRRLSPSRSDGPTEQQVRSARSELESIMSERDRVKMKKVEAFLNQQGGTGPSWPAIPPISLRTARHWRRELYNHYGRQVI